MENNHICSYESRGCRVERAFALEMGVEVKFENNFFM